MSEKKPKRREVKPFVGEEDSGRQPTSKEMPERTETKTEDSPLFQKLDAIVSAINELKDALIEKDQGIVHQLCRIADAKTGTTERKLIQEGVDALRAPKPSTQVSTRVQETIKTPPIQKPEPSPSTSNVANARMLFKQELEDLLLFEEDVEGEFIKVKPRQYLGSDNFAKIASTIREAGGEYVSAGRDSHFRVPIPLSA